MNISIKVVCAFCFLAMLSSCKTLESRAITDSYEQSLHIKSYQILDGDTIKILDPDYNSISVRLIGIDAPEQDQPFGKESLIGLKKCLDNKPLIVQWSKKDKYNRLLAKVISNNKDCNLNQVQKGLAWHYKYFEKDQPILDRKSYSLAEQNARSKKIGVWASNCVIAPWDWRRKNFTVCS